MRLLAWYFALQPNILLRSNGGASFDLGAPQAEEDNIMSTKTLDALDLVPGKARKGGPWASVITLFDAIGEGVAAAHQYQTLVGHGVRPDRAARIVFETMSKKQ
jgi:hypothetical protein